MHEKLFESPERPFRATPDTRFYFPYESVEAARQTVVRAMLRAEGPAMVLGGAGLGKSLLGMVVAQDLATRFDVVQLHAARLCSRRALLQNILFELQLPYRDLSEGDLRLSILTRLEPSAEYAPEGVLMIVDEAHTLPAKLLDELRLINNFTRANQPRTRLVLIGNLRLEHTFAEPQMESFNQRLAARCYLQPMNRQQTCDYIRHQLTIAGLKPSQLITEEAMHTIYVACDGVPRLTNQVMDHALALAIARSQCPVSSALVEEAWSDLQQLPAPWHVGADKSPVSTPSGAEVHSTVEFGALQDDESWPSDPLTNSAAMDQSYSDQINAHSAAPTNAPTPSFFAAFAPPEPVARQSPAADVPHAVDCCRTGEMKANPDKPVSLPAQEETREMRVLPQSSNCFQPASDQLTACAVDSNADAKDPLVRPCVVFDAGEAMAQLKGQASSTLRVTGQAAVKPEMQSVTIAKAQPGQAQESFFSDRPTDERLLALEDEQHGYDAMGVWENDPPLAPPAARSEPQDTPIFHHSPAASQLFGDDFEVEEDLPANDSGLDRLAVHSARQAAETADYIDRMEQFAQAINARDTEDGQQAPTSSHRSAEWDTWTLNVAPLDAAKEAAIHDEIEDMVSQLNFAAFSVEPFSVEQIPLESPEQRPRHVRDASRKGPNDEIYTMHRPLAAAAEDELPSGKGLFAASADDDRDLLVIEEDLPLTSHAADEKHANVTKIAPYSQLFAKLRK